MDSRHHSTMVLLHSGFTSQVCECELLFLQILPILILFFSMNYTITFTEKKKKNLFGLGSIYTSFNL